MTTRTMESSSPTISTAHSPSTGRSSSSISRTSRCSGRGSVSGSRAAYSLPGFPYVGADFRFDPPVLEPFPLPSIGIVGTGKRVGKTAITAHAARLYARDRKVVVVAMGRGGPPEPEVATVAPDIDALLELSRAGRHAASDYLETAALVGVETVGCRRCGGGLAGSSRSPTSTRARSLRSSSGPISSSSTAAARRSRRSTTSRRVLVVNSATDPEVATGYLNGFRHLVSDLVDPDDGRGGLRLGGASRRRGRARAAGAGDDSAPAPRRARSRGERSRSSRPRQSRRTTCFAAHLREEHGADIVHVSGSLSDRRTLLQELERVEAEVFLVELKAAAIDVVAEAARERGVDVVLPAATCSPWTARTSMPSSCASRRRPHDE